MAKVIMLRALAITAYVLLLLTHVSLEVQDR